MINNNNNNKLNSPAQQHLMIHQKTSPEISKLNSPFVTNRDRFRTGIQRADKSLERMVSPTS